MVSATILKDRAENSIPQITEPVHIAFLDPPFNQDKEYRMIKDALPEQAYWGFITDILKAIYDKMANGGAIYFMQREKNTGKVIQSLADVGFTFQNLIVWQKKTSPVPMHANYNLAYQVIVYATKGESPRTFNQLRIDLPPPANYKVKRPNGVELSNVWGDIRELTSGYYAGIEPIRIKGSKIIYEYKMQDLEDKSIERFHKQQSPLALLVRIILASSRPGDTFLDCCAGTGTGAVVAKQLGRCSISIEIDPLNVECIRERVRLMRKADDVAPLKRYYRFTKNLDQIWSDPMGKLELQISEPTPTKKPADLFQFL
jgi:DNA modification methylase